MESGKISKDLAAKILNIEDLEQLITQVSVNVPLTYQNQAEDPRGSQPGRTAMKFLLQSSQMRSKCFRSDTICSANLNPVWIRIREIIFCESSLKLIREELGEESTS